VITGAKAIKELVTQNLANEVVVEYVEVIDRQTLKPISEITDGAQILVAANVGGVRLIDNICLIPNGEEEKRKTIR
jgi:pantoate--beta-alanine ligase